MLPAWPAPHEPPPSIPTSDSCPLSRIPTRLAIVRELAESNETCACDFTAACDVGQPTVSHHLRVLREAGVVTSERRGQWIYYRLAPDVAVRLATIARGMIPGGLIPVSDLVTRRRGTTATMGPAVSAPV